MKYTLFRQLKTPCNWLIQRVSGMVGQEALIICLVLVAILLGGIVVLVGQEALIICLVLAAILLGGIMVLE